MNDTIRSIGPVPKIDQAERIAAGLEHLAGEIRQGKFRFSVERCAIVLSGRVRGADDFAMTYFGEDMGVHEIVGLLELAKLQAATPDEG